MASYVKRDDKVRVSIRKKGFNIFKTFSDMEMAKLYAKYKEDLIENMESFDVDDSSLMTLEAAIEYKIKKMQDEDKDPRSIHDIIALKKEFHDWMDYPISDINYDLLKKRVQIMLKSKVKRGGSQKEGSGIVTIQSPITVRKKMAVLSSVFSCLTSSGLNINNDAYKILGFLNDLINKEKKDV